MTQRISINMHASERGIRISLKQCTDSKSSETSGSILEMLYGYTTSSSDPLDLIKIVEHAMDGFAVASEPGRWWVDSFPLCEFGFVMLQSLQLNGIVNSEVPS